MGERREALISAALNKAEFWERMDSWASLAHCLSEHNCTSDAQLPGVPLELFSRAIMSIAIQRQ